MNRRRATADSWQIRPMPPAQKELPVEGIYATEEYEQLTWGFIPRGQDDKWFIYLEGEWLHFHRSQTGTCIFQLRLVQEEDHYRAETAVVNQDPQQYRGPDDNYSVALISYLIDRLLLGRFASLPTPGNLSESDEQRHREHVIGKRPSGNNGSISLRMVDNGDE